MIVFTVSNYNLISSNSKEKFFKETSNINSNLGDRGETVIMEACGASVGGSIPPDCPFSNLEAQAQRSAGRIHCWPKV